MLDFTNILEKEGNTMSEMDSVTISVYKYDEMQKELRELREGIKEFKPRLIIDG